MASQQASLGGVEAGAVGVVGGVGRRRRRRRQRARSKDSGSGAPADQASLPPTTTAFDFAHSSTIACCPLELDPLDVVLCEGTGTPTWVDPMLDELDASLQLAASPVVNRSVGALALERPSTMPAASLGVQALLVGARSPLTMVPLSFADAEASGVEAVGPLDVKVGDTAQVGSEVPLVLDLCHSGMDVCTSGKTTSATVWAGGSPPLAPDLATPTVPAAALSIVESLEERLSSFAAAPHPWAAEVAQTSNAGSRHVVEAQCAYCCPTA